MPPALLYENDPPGSKIPSFESEPMTLPSSPVPRGGVLAFLIGVSLLSAPWPPVRSDDAAGGHEAGGQIDLTPNFARWGLAIKKQGRRNTCSVFATVAAMEFALSRKSEQGIRLSEEFLNWAANQVVKNTRQDRGQFFSHLLDGFERFGICKDGEMPYARAFSPEYEPSERAKESAKAVRSSGLRAHWIKKNDGKKDITDEHIAQIKATLDKGWPVCAGSHHSLLVAGYRDDASLPGGGQLLVRDSGGGDEKSMTYEAAKARLCDLIWYEAP